MPRRIFKSIQVKLVAAVGLAALCAGLAAYLLYVLAARLTDNSSLFRFLFQVVRDGLGEQAAVLFTCLVLFVVFFLLLTRRTVGRIDRIITAVRQMAGGRLDTRIELKSADEIGELASAIDGMAEKLQNSFEEERRAEQAKRDLITSVSHDLRTPLTSIIGFQGLLMDRSRHSDAELERYAAIAHKKALRLQAQIDELFEYTKVSYGGIRLNKQPINLSELAGQIVEEMYPVFEGEGMRCRLALPDERIVAAADGELLHRLLENLLNNAVRYGAEGLYVDVSLKREGGFAEISVVNYGATIPPEDLPNIFQRFYRVERSRSRQTGGTGLGLAIAANIVELHGGSISAQSADGRTCFTVRLPASSGEFKE